METQADELVKQGITLIKSGDKKGASRILYQAIKSDPNHQAAWLAMAECVDTDDKKRDCLERVRAINPNTRLAQQALAGLALLMPPPAQPFPPAQPASASSSADHSADTLPGRVEAEAVPQQPPPGTEASTAAQSSPAAEPPGPPDATIPGDAETQPADEATSPPQDDQASVSPSTPSAPSTSSALPPLSSSSSEATRTPPSSLPKTISGASPVEGIVVDTERTSNERAQDFLREVFEETSTDMNSLAQRIQGVFTFKSSAYRDIVDSPDASGQAAAIQVLLPLVVSIISGLLGVVLAGTPIVVFLISIILTPIIALIAWFLSSLLYSFVANRFFQGNATPEKILRATGFTSLYGLPMIIPVVGVLIATPLILVSLFLGIREATELDTAKTIFTILTVMVILTIVACIVGGVLVFLLTLLGVGASAAASYIP